MMRTKAILPCLLLWMGCTGSVTGGVPGDIDASLPPETDATSEVVLQCGHVDANLATVTPTVMLLVDRSGSMTSAFGDTTRWSAVKSTLMAADTGVVPTLDNAVRFGASFYTSDSEAGVCPFVAEVAPAISNEAAIRAAYDSLSPLGHTPTGESLRTAHLALEALPADEPKVIVLATDGLPDTCAIPHPNNTPEALAEAIGATRDAQLAGIATFLISVGPDVAEAHLQDMANAGVGLAPGSDEDAPYFIALNPMELVEAFESIIHGVRLCTFPIETTANLGSAEEGLHIVGGIVTVDGMELGDGQWRIWGNQTVEILGEACENLKTGEHEVEGEFVCEAVLM